MTQCNEAVRAPAPGDLLECTSADLEQLCTETFRQRSGRGKKLAELLFRRGITDFDAMEGINRPLREMLALHSGIFLPTVRESRTAGDRTQKLLYELHDGLCVEGVVIPGKGGRQTLCISTQVGCGIGCAFCLTASGGLVRNLRAGEMVGQILAARGYSQTPITNLVLMGQGEPLANYGAVRRFIDVATDVNGMAYPPRKVTVSTAGLVPYIDRLGVETSVSLAVSLNATTDAVRDRIIPINRMYPLAELLAALHRFCAAGKRRVLIEYVLLKGVNDSPDDARRLLGLLADLPCMVNLLPFNTYVNAQFTRPSGHAVQRFWEILQGAGVTTIVRDGHGSEIQAACGQLLTENAAGMRRGRYPA